MTLDDGSAAAAELRELVGLLRENLVWQAASGVVGVPRGAGVRRLEPVIRVPPFPREERDEARVRRAPLAEAGPYGGDRGAEGDPEAKASQQSQEAAPQAAPQQPRQVAVPRVAPVHVAPDKRAAVLAELALEVKGCTQCGLHAGRTQTVFSRGNPLAELMIVGEGPGAEEDAQGEPFVGKAGQLLDRMIGAMGYGRDEVYIANIVKCRPPNNRTPQPEEMQTCLPYLHRQIEIVSPKAILAMGNTAVRGLLGVSEGIMRLRGKWKLYRGRIPVMPTYHPAYLLREETAKQDAKREVWVDLKAVLAHLGRGVPTKQG